MTFNDVKFQLRMTHIEYVDLYTRPSDRPVPKFDLINHKALENKSTYWIGYADNSKQGKILLPSFIHQATITEECGNKIWRLD